MSHARHVDAVMRTLPTMGRLCSDDHDPEMFRSVIERIGDKWSVLIIGILSERSHRFTDLLRTIPGISRRMLTVTLRALERDGLVTRTVHAEVPPRVEYAVTDLGLSLGGVVQGVAGWASKHQSDILRNREQYDQIVQERLDRHA